MTLICEFYNDYDQHGGYFYMISNKTIKELEADGYKFGRHESLPYSWLEAYEVEIDTAYIFDEYYKLIKDKQ